MHIYIICQLFQDLFIMKTLINLIGNMLDPIVEIVIFLIVIVALVVGIIFAILGKREKNNGKYNPAKLRFGIVTTCVSGVFLVAFTILSFFLHGGFGALGVFLFFFSPIVILAGLILTLSLGIYCVAVGHSNPKNPVLIRRGRVLLIINVSVIVTLVILFILFASGVIPIRLM